MSDFDGFKKAAEEKKKKEELFNEKFKLFTVSDLVPIKAQSILFDRDNPLSTGFPTFDEITKRRKRGRLIFHIGYGGTKKSLSCLQSMLIGYEYQKVGAIYSNMEMANINLLDRILDMTFSFDFHKASDIFEKEVEDDSKRDEAIIRMIQKLSSHFSDKLRINGTGNMITSDYLKLIEIYKETTGDEISQLIVDGMSMTGGVGTETERMDTNSKELKQLANSTNIAIDAIVHCSKASSGKAGTLHTRDLKPYIRGSEKLADNCDRYYMYSLCQDETKGDGYYRSDVGWIRLVDKRGTGEVKDLIYDFNPVSLRMTESNDDPFLYEIKSKKPDLFS